MAFWLIKHISIRFKLFTRVNMDVDITSFARALLANTTVPFVSVAAIVLRDRLIKKALACSAEGKVLHYWNVFQNVRK